MTLSRSSPVLALVSVLLFGCKDDPPTLVETFQCEDGIDNDGDGITDFPDDPGCTSATDDSEDSLTLPQCSDGRDNDGDGKLDFPGDPGCVSPNQDDETDDCPTGPNCPQCGNAIDDDGNGTTDYPADPGCTSASDPDEIVLDPFACGPTLTIRPLPSNGVDMATFDPTSTSAVISPCGGGAGAPAFAYELNLDAPSVIVASTNDVGTTADTVIDLRSAECDAATSEIACGDDVDTANDNLTSEVTTSVPAGRYYLIVEGHDSSVTGSYVLTVHTFAGEGTNCTDTAQCGPGLVCRVPMGQTQMICTQPVCRDGVDDDGDGKTDFPQDPGCLSLDDNDEADDCPTGPNCPQCGNGTDDDGDLLIDFPNDPSCTAASSSSESCNGEMDPIGAVAMATTSGGTLVGAHDDHVAECGALGGGGVDVLYTISVPAMRSLVVDTIGMDTDTVVSLLPPTCAEPNLGCDDDGGGTIGGPSRLVVENLAASTYVIAVDAYSSSTTRGGFPLHVSGVIAPGGSCEPGVTLGGALACPGANPCIGVVGSRICQVNQCSDGLDNDSDLLMDYPNDPGCADPEDDGETDTCPGAGCPACSNTADDDTDTRIDALDVSCYAASSNDEAFCNPEVDAIVRILNPSTTGTTVGKAHNITPPAACSAGNTAADAALALILPVPVASLEIDTFGSDYDTVVSLLPSMCSGVPIGCNDDDPNAFFEVYSAISLTNVAAGSYAVSVDGYQTDTGGYVVRVLGTVATGTACTSSLFGSGVLVCATGTTCTAGTCQ